MTRLVLASRSAARARLLTDAGVRFTAAVSSVDESALKAQALASGVDPKGVAVELAAAKALDVSRETDGLIIGADQTLALDGRLFDKPPSLAAAREQLGAFRGCSHQLHSAACVAEQGRVLWRTVDTVTLHMRPFSDAFLDQYLAAEGEGLLACVGAYQLEGLGAQLFERIDGDYFTVLGLPLLPLLAFLREQGELVA